MLKRIFFSAESFGAVFVMKDSGISDAEHRNMRILVQNSIGGKNHFVIFGAAHFPKENGLDQNMRSEASNVLD